MSKGDAEKDGPIRTGKNGAGDWDEEKVFRRGDGDPESLCESLEAQLDLERQRALRVMADFENHKRRVRKERETFLLYSNEKLLKDLLPVLDDLERAVDQAEAGGDQTLDSFVQGVRLILGRILGVLERSGVTSFASIGEPFDPTLHEAVMQRLDEEAPPSSVLEDLEKGYMLYNRLLRPAKTVVNALRASRSAPKPAPKPELESIEADETLLQFEESSPDFDFVDEVEVMENEIPQEDVGEEEEIPPSPSEDPTEDSGDPAPENEITAGAFEIDEDALGSLEDWDEEFNS